MEWRLNDDDAHESLMIEVEMLTSSYTEDELQWRPAEKSDTNPTLWLSARPKTAADTRLQFVKADLCFTVCKDYPGVAPEVEVLEDGAASTVFYNDGTSVAEPELTHPNFPICNTVIDKTKSGWRNTMHSRVYKWVLNFWIREGVPEKEACDRASKYWLHTCSQLGI